MKTVRQHIEELPEPYRSQALGNMVDAENELESVHSTAEALTKAFLWQESREGLEYWIEIKHILLYGPAPGEEYTLRHSGEFCHAIGTGGTSDFSEDRNDDVDRAQAVFVGCVEINNPRGWRNIFVDPECRGARIYYMFDATNPLNYIDFEKTDR